MSQFIERLMAEVFRAEGDPNADAKAAKAAAVLYRSGVVDDAKVAKAERDAKIYALRSQLTVLELSARFDMGPRHVFRVIKAELARRKAG